MARRHPDLRQPALPPRCAFIQNVAEGTGDDCAQQVGFGFQCRSLFPEPFVASKKGWEYLWVRYADEEDAGSSTLVKKPVAAYVERVYEEGNFAALGIGT
jgi:hypothetical protein